MASVFNEKERQLRELIGVLDMAVLLAVDVICEHDSHGVSKHDWQRRLIQDATRKLADNGVFAGRFALYDDHELRLMRQAIEYARGDNNTWEADPEATALSGEMEFELRRRGLPLYAPIFPPSDESSTVVRDAEGLDERGEGTGEA